MKLYNTLSRQKQDFIPRQNNVAGIYSCGPTVYNYAHIGNMRTYIFMDWLRRVLRFEGFGINHVMNITDVGHLVSDGDDGEDKMEKGAREQKLTPWQIAEKFTQAFMSDLDALNIEHPEIICKATDHIGEMIEFVQALCEKGYGYETSDGIYFDIGAFPGYGKLSRIDLEGQRAGARVEINDEKRSPEDFALWKKAPPEHIMQWPSPWGQGYPGWHIECSAMARKYLGPRFDIHTGGVDHIPVHHENEIAQSEGLLGHEPADIWLHGEFMLVNNGKMSKSLGNTYTISDLEMRGFSPMHFRYFCAGGHYRNKLNFTFESMEAAKTSYERLLTLIHSHKNGTDCPDAEVLKKLRAEMRDAIADDLNIPKAIGTLWTLCKSPCKSREIYDTVMEIDSVLGLRLDSEPALPEPETPDAEIAQLIEQRQAARKNKNFAEADKIRGELRNRGIELTDTKDGVTWKRI
ncbi:MAG: cysteine--tRNA ligase [Oscillospiraceae bacterium]|nr:cysteine--tRNA ligase [Oscillospiraceae bacterium]